MESLPREAPSRISSAPDPIHSPARIPASAERG